MPPGIIVHGGSGSWADEQDAPKKESLREATLAGWEILKNGGTALDAVEAAVRILEDFPLFDAGIGSYLNQNGEVEMDALFIDAATRNYGAVAAVKQVRYPISLARKIMEDTPQVMLVGAGADAMAAKLGFEIVPNMFFVTDAELNRWREKRAAQPTGTVGAVAVDAAGNLASATSTGGTPDKPAGRVGDSPIFGAGGYADNQLGAAGATGVGEHSMRLMLSRYAVDQLGTGLSAAEAVKASEQYANDLFDDSQIGLILVDKSGAVAWGHTTDKISAGWIDRDGNPQTTMGYGDS